MIGQTFHVGKCIGAKQSRSVLSLILFMASFVARAEITGISPQVLKVTRGDKVTLSVATSGANPVVEWWREGRIICRNLTCQIDTTNFSPGQSVVDVVTEDSMGISIGRVSIGASDALPLYAPKNLIPELEAPNSNIVSIPNGRWVIIERSGGVARSFSGKSNEVIQSSMFEAVATNAIYSVLEGSSAIVRKVGLPEQLLVFPDAKFTFKDEQFELLSGRAIWRASPENTTDLIQVAVAGGLIKAVGPSMIGLDVGFITKNERRAVIQNFQSNSLWMRCPSNSKDVVIGKRRAGVFVLNAESHCTKVDSEDFIADDSSAWIASWSPWWFADQMASAIDRWRSDSALFRLASPLPERIATAEKLKSQENCADALDLVTARPSLESRSSEVLRIVGFCQFELGMNSKSLLTFAELDRRGVDPAWSAFMMGRAYQRLNRHELALHWFSKARSRGYPNFRELGRLAVISSEALKVGIDKLFWLEVMWRDESDDTLSKSAQSEYQIWHSQRPAGGVVTGAVLMDSQAVPLNAKASKPTPIIFKASRSPVITIDGQWWSQQTLSQGVKVRLHGTHDFRTPSAPSLSFASSSIHDVGADLKVDDDRASGTGFFNQWLFAIGGRFGVGISGGESQRDRYGWTVTVTRPDWNGFSLGFESGKYLDPKPGGADVIDLDLNRFTGEVDHSHLDQKIYVGFSSYDLSKKWTFRLGYGSVDFRTFDMDAYDHSLFSSDFTLDWAFGPKLFCAATANYLSRVFKVSGTEQVTHIQIAPAFRIFPLWRVALTGGFEWRQVSNDVLASWMRHAYGLQVQTDL